jgi:hypothetical protein
MFGILLTSFEEKQNDFSHMDILFLKMYLGPWKSTDRNVNSMSGYINIKSKSFMPYVIVLRIQFYY